MPLPLAEQIVNTQEAYDPARVCVLVGGAAVHMQLAAAGLEPYPTEDADYLCPPRFYSDLADSGPRRDDLASFTIAWPNERQQAVGCTDTSLKLVPAGRFADQRLKATFAVGMGARSLYYVGYGDMHNGNVFDVDGVPCLDLPDILVWKATIGRRKDLSMVRHVMRVAVLGGILKEAEYDRIDRECRVSEQALLENPGRYFARVPGS